MYPRAEKKLCGVIYRGKLQVHPKAEKQVKFSSFSLCIEDDG